MSHLLTQLPPRLTAETVPRLAPALAEISRGEGPLAVDLTPVAHIDSAGVAFLTLVARRASAAERDLHVTGASPAIARTLRMFPALPAATAPERTSSNPIADLGARGESAINEAGAFLQLSADALWFTGMTLLGRYRLRPGVVTWEMAAMGSRALGVVGLIAFLVGATMGLQSAAQLRRFGADIFVVDLIVITLLRELGPLMAAIVVAGRSGAAIAAEIGTMVVTEEVDALRTMGLHPIRFLVVPKVIAITVVQPVLTIFANALGVLGGFLVATVYLDVGADSFLNRTLEIVQVRDVMTGLVKSLLFAWLIVLLGAHFGMTTRGGADAVGRSTTTSVVAGIFAVVVADAFASLVFYFGG